MGCFNGDEPLIFFDSEDDDDRATVFFDHHRFRPGSVDQPPEMIFRVLGGLRVHGTPLPIRHHAAILAILATFGKELEQVGCDGIPNSHGEGAATLKRDLLQRLGIKPGERVEFEKLPGGELKVRAARPSGTIDSFIHALDGK